jgi:hypothetical protein
MAIEGFCYWHDLVRREAVIGATVFKVSLSSGVNPTFPFCLSLFGQTSPGPRRWLGDRKRIFYKSQLYFRPMTTKSQLARWLAEAFTDRRFIPR